MGDFLDLIVKGRVLSRQAESDDKVDFKLAYDDMNRVITIEALRKFWELTEDFMDHPKLMTEIIAMRAINKLVDKHCQEEGIGRNEREEHYEEIVDSLADMYDDDTFRKLQGEELQALSIMIMEGLLDLMQKATGLVAPK